MGEAKRGQAEGRPCIYQTHGLARANASPHFGFFVAAATPRAAAYATDALVVPGMCDAVVGDCESRLMGAPMVPLDTTRTEWSSYPSGVDGGALDAGDVDVDIDDSGVSGVPGACV